MTTNANQTNKTTERVSKKSDLGFWVLDNFKDEGGYLDCKAYFYTDFEEAEDKARELKVDWPDSFITIAKEIIEITKEAA